MKLDFNCRTCRYDLTSLELTAVCTECGTAVASTLSQHSFLAAPVDRLDVLRRGLLFVYLSSVLSLIGVVLIGCLGPGLIGIAATTTMTPGMTPAQTEDAMVETMKNIAIMVGLAAAAGGVVLLVFFLIGAVRSTKPIGAETAEEQRTFRFTRLAIVFALTAAIMFGVVVGATAVPQMNYPGRLPLFPVLLILVSGSFALLSGTAVFWLLVRTCRIHLERSHQWMLARRTRVAVIVVVSAAGLLQLLSLFDIGFLTLLPILVLLGALVLASTARSASKAVKLVALAQPNIAGIELPEYVDPGSPPT